jgi:hypothetical protein
MPLTMLKELPRGASLTMFLCGGVAEALFLVMMGLKIISLPLGFDEYFHAHYLWLVSIGRIPHVDFWCHYPSLGYVMTRPFFRLLPESIYAVFALRFFGMFFFLGTLAALAYHAQRLRADWLWGVLPLAAMLTPDVAMLVVNFRTDTYAALAAILALTIMFRNPTPPRSALAAGLAALSVIIMPKYVYPLLFALIAYCGYLWFNEKGRRRSLILPAAAGGAIAVILTQSLLLTSRLWLWDDLFWSPVLMQRFFSHCAKTETSLTTQLSTVASYFLENWWVAILVLAGVSGWLIVESKHKGVRLWVGSGIIAGLAVFWGTCKMPFLQYFIPGLFCFALYVPYAFVLLKRPVFQFAATIVLIGLCMLMVIKNAKVINADLASQVASEDFKVRQELLDHLPRSERVVGFVWTHPCFREDQTFVTWDEAWGEPRGFVPILPKNSRAYACFQPEYLEQSLEQSSPPSWIAIDSTHCPPGWSQLLSTYLDRHAALYRKALFKGFDVYVRNDLFPR